MKIILTEMAYQRAKAIDIIEGLQDSINLHLIKYYLKQDSHHLMEILAWILKIDNIIIKGNNKLKSKDYFYVLFSEPFEPNNYNTIQHRLDQINFIWKTNYIIDTKKFYSILKEFYTKLSEMLSENILNDPYDITDLIKKYF